MPEGEIEFRGRIDNQVKLSGYRIELEEVEAAIRSYPKVREVVAVVREDRPAERRLVGYVAVDQEVGAGELRAHLLARLPEYMVPAVYVTMAELPLMPNGKVDRQSLPRPELLEHKTAIIGPRDSTEIQLKSMWEEILGRDNIGVRDNFFALGGHSIKAVALYSRIAETYRSPFLVRHVFEFPTIEGQAAYLKQKRSPAPPSLIVPIQSRGSRRPLFCIHAGGGGVSEYISLAYRLGQDQPCYGIQSPGLESEQTSALTIESMAAAYILEMKTIQPVGPYQLAGWSMGGAIAYEMAVQLSEAGEEVSLLAAIDTVFGDPALAELFTQGDDRRLEEHLAEAERAALEEYASARYNISPEALQSLTPEERIGHCLEVARSLDLVPSDIRLDQFRHFVRMLGVNLIATIRYRPRPYRGTVTLFRTPIEAGADPCSGFGSFAIGGIEVYEAPGNHYTLIQEPNVKQIAETLQADILRREPAKALNAQG
jgi:thioesterase domain-containing protein